MGQHDSSRIYENGQAIEKLLVFSKAISHNLNTNSREAQVYYEATRDLIDDEITDIRQRTAAILLKLDVVMRHLGLVEKD